jgi:hypothetical protein
MITTAFVRLYGFHMRTVPLEDLMRPFGFLDQISTDCARSFLGDALTKVSNVKGDGTCTALKLSREHYLRLVLLNCIFFGTKACRRVN